MEDYASDDAGQSMVERERWGYREPVTDKSTRVTKCPKAKSTSRLIHFEEDIQTMVYQSRESSLQRCGKN